MSWDDIFKHVLFNDTFDKKMDFTKSVIEPTVYLMNELRQKIVE